MQNLTTEEIPNTEGHPQQVGRVHEYDWEEVDPLDDRTSPNLLYWRHFAKLNTEARVSSKGEWTMIFHTQEWDYKTPFQIKGAEVVGAQASYSHVDELEQTFNTLVEEWRTETELTSSYTNMILHSAYQKIIGLGPDAIPLLLRELERSPDHWFWALRHITRENPVEEEDAGRLDKMTEAWLQWGRQHGYL